MTQRDDNTLLADIKKATELIHLFIQGVDEVSFIKDTKTNSSVCYQLAIIGEAANKLSPAFKTKLKELPWRQIIGLRNHLIHAYHGLDMEIVWQAATVELPKLIKQLGL